MAASVQNIASAALLSALLMSGAVASAHPLAPSLLELRERADGLVDARWRTPTQRAPGSELAPLLPARCAVADHGGVSIDGSMTEAAWTLQCGEAGIRGGRVGARGIAGSGADVLLRVQMDDGRTVQAILTADAPSMDIPARQTRWQTAAHHLQLGLSHIAGGRDHLLFVLALMMLVPAGMLLLKTITAFTLGHSVTLSLAALGIVHVPQALAEVAIAASLLVLACELARGGSARDSEAQDTVLRRHPWPVAASFGLLHGLGFAGALSEAGLPGGEIPLALASFNAGIELGQIALVAVVLAVQALLARVELPALRPVPIYLIGSCAAFWLLERAAALV
ncbi:MAG TPA: HupE/UreJ family protein [Candidatus Limnocylindrales bacterium]|nr:HupE/UreJ family protein [Candidatus Limnocylindrales bacterium]